ncbi:Dimerisation domain-containing protein [Pelosinus fermentans]|uniref:methyltransferase n=1 Tax=Pelosinus fermentans TaxID=365349 RepID=UPI00026863EF|nr:methyltransferase [Pelosinus fermentans]OAM92473.1 O-methyltransferase family 2 [Pelosinus fermentans DSM 17108]SDQ46047.1 Dimerisation domain-containing protein [Pelosinus fermentans]
MMEYPTHSPRKFIGMLQQYRETQLLFAGISLKVFDYLKHDTSAEKIASMTGYDERNLTLFLNSLAAIGLLEKNNHQFRNTPETELFLNQNSPYYLGEYLTFWNKMTGLDQVEELVRLGPDPAIQEQNQGKELFDFRKLARLTAVEARTGRVQSFLRAAAQFVEPTAPLRILDLGGGSGMMAIEFVRQFPLASGVIFEQPGVADVPEEFVAEGHLEHRLSIMRGDFMTDPIGGNYDLIIASGILDFANANLKELTAKIAQALTPSGYLYLVSHRVSDDYISPKESIVGWLSSHLAGLDILQTRSNIELALTSAGFRKTEIKPLDGAIQNLMGEFYTLSK